MHSRSVDDSAEPGLVGPVRLESGLQWESAVQSMLGQGLLLFARSSE